MKKVMYWVILTVIALGITLGLAAAGEPQSAWVVCDIFGLEICP